MIGLEKVTGRIISEAKIVAGSIIEEARKKEADIKLSAAEKISAINDRTNSEIEVEGSNIVSRAKSASVMQVRNILLAAKGEALDQTFSSSIDALCSMPESEYLDFIIKCVSECVDSNMYSKLCWLTFNAKDSVSTGIKVIDRLTKKYPNRVFELGTKPASIKGGVLLDFGETEVDCSVETIVNQHRPSLEGKVCTILFDRSDS